MKIFYEFVGCQILYFSEHVRLMAPKINAGKSSDRNQVFGCPAHYNGHESTCVFLRLRKKSIEHTYEYLIYNF